MGELMDFGPPTSTFTSPHTPTSKPISSTSQPKWAAKPQSSDHQTSALQSQRPGAPRKVNPQESGFSEVLSQASANVGPAGGAVRPPSGNGAVSPNSGNRTPSGDEFGKIRTVLSELTQNVQQLGRAIHTIQPDPIEQESQQKDWRELKQSISDIQQVLGIPIPENVLDENRNFRHGALSSLSQKVQGGFSRIETMLLGPADPRTKKRKWTYLTPLIRSLMEEQLEELSETLETLRPQTNNVRQDTDFEVAVPAKRNKETKPKPPEPAPYEAENEGAAPSLDLTGILQLAERLTQLGNVRTLKLMQRLPDLFDKLEYMIDDLPKEFGSSESNDTHIRHSCDQIHRRYHNIVEDWLGRCYVARIVPELNELFDSDRHEKAEYDRPTQDRDLNQTVAEVVHPGYMFDDGMTRIPLRKPRVVLWRYT